MKKMKKLIAKQHIDRSRSYETLLTQNYITYAYGEKGLKFILREIHNRYDNLIRRYKKDIIDTNKDKVFTNGFDAWSLLKVCLQMEQEHKLKKI